MNAKKIFIYFFLALLISAIANIFMFPEQAAAASGRKTVRVGYMWGYNYQEGAADDKEKYGFSYDYLQQVRSYVNWDYVYVYGSWEELIRKLAEGKIDIMSGISKTPAREKQMLFPDIALSNERYYIFARQADESLYPDTSSLKGKTIGVSKDTLTRTDLISWNQKNSIGLKIIDYPDDKSRLTAQISGETDLTADIDGQVSKDSGLVPVVNFGGEPNYVAVNKNRPDLLYDLNNADAIIYATTPRFMSDLYAKYFSNTAVRVFLTSEESAWFQSHPVIHIGYNSHLAPFTKTNSAGKAEGMYIDLIQYTLKSMGLTNVVSFEPYDDETRLIWDLQNGKIDAALPVNNSLWRAEQAGIFQTINVVSAQADLIRAGNAETGINNNTVFAVSDEDPLQEQYIQSHYPKNERVRFATNKEAINAVRQYKANAMVMNAYAVAIYLHDEHDLQITALPNAQECAIAVAPDHAALLTALNQGIATWGADNIQESLLKHINANQVPSVRQFFKAHYIATGISAAIIMTLITALVSIAFYRNRQRKAAIRHANTDPMTGMLNRRAFDEDIQKLRQKPLPVDFSITFLDINGLKTANDNIGHAAGDELIYGLASCLTKAFKDHGIDPARAKVYRTGGDEFVILATIPRTDWMHVYEHFKDLQRHWQGTQVKKLSVATGCVFACEHQGADIKELLHLADQYMYMKKRKTSRSELEDGSCLSQLETEMSGEFNRTDLSLLRVYFRSFQRDYDKDSGMPGLFYLLRALPEMAREIQAQGGKPVLLALKWHHPSRERSAVQYSESLQRLVYEACRAFGKEYGARFSADTLLFIVSDQALKLRLHSLQKMFVPGELTTGSSVMETNGTHQIDYYIDQAIAAADK